MDGSNALDVLAERGFVYRVSDEAGLRAAPEEPITLDCGYDPSAGSLTAARIVETRWATVAAPVDRRRDPMVPLGPEPGLGLSV